MFRCVSVHLGALDVRVGGGDHSGQALRAAVHTAKDAGGGPLLPSQARRVWKVKLRGGALVSVLVCNVTTLMLDPDQ